MSHNRHIYNIRAHPHPISSNVCNSTCQDDGKDQSTSLDLNLLSKMHILEFNTAITLVVIVLNLSKAGMIQSNSTTLVPITNDYTKSYTLTGRSI